VVEQNPGLYAETMRTRRAEFFGGTVRWVCFALWHSAVALTVPLLALWAPDSSGRSSGGLTAFGTTAYTAIVLIVNLKVSTNRVHNVISRQYHAALQSSAAPCSSPGLTTRQLQRHRTALVKFCLQVVIRSATLGWPAFWMVGVISIGCLFPFLIIMGSSLSASGGEDADLIGVPGKLMSDPRFWLALLCSTVTALLPDVLAAGMQRLCAPADYQILQVRALSCVCRRLACELLRSSDVGACCRHATRLVSMHALPQ
jgi:magnesium-transporting ATPase (P-type)